MTTKGVCMRCLGLISKEEKEENGKPFLCNNCGTSTSNFFGIVLHNKIMQLGKEKAGKAILERIVGIIGENVTVSGYEIKNLNSSIKISTIDKEMNEEFIYKVGKEYFNDLIRRERRRIKEKTGILFDYAAISTMISILHSANNKYQDQVMIQKVKQELVGRKIPLSSDIKLKKPFNIQVFEQGDHCVTATGKAEMDFREIGQGYPKNWIANMRIIKMPAIVLYLSAFGEKHSKAYIFVGE